MYTLENIAPATGNIIEKVQHGMRQHDFAHENVTSTLMFLSMMLMSLQKSRSSGKPANFFKREYDYIVVGGGSAGSVLASRLSEEPCVDVLLLEAGGEPPTYTEVPIFQSFAYGSSIDWQYKTTPQKYGDPTDGNRLVWPSGKVLGGTSVINGMFYVRGNKKNYDGWAEDGATGWSYDEVLPYFKKMENNRNINELDQGYHSRLGPVTVEKPHYAAEIKQPLLKAFKAMGYDVVDVNGEKHTGVYDVQGTTRRHRRCSAAKAYLDDIRDRPNLDIMMHSFATKILTRKISQDESEAYGIEFVHSNMTHTVFARKEVIICSGTVRTPQILMLSGIGPKEHLQKFNIPVVSDLPVGKNLHDHVMAIVMYNVNDSITPISEKLLNPKSMLNYVIYGKGPYGSLSGVSLHAFVNSSQSSTDFPRQEIGFVEVVDLSSFDSLKKVNSAAPQRNKPGYICFSYALQPYSRGEITLNSTNAFDMPNIDPNYYDDERDIRDVVEGLKLCHAVSTHPEMSLVQPQLVRRQYPMCEPYYDSNLDEYFTCVAKQKANPVWHAVGTAKMGNWSDITSVVDPELRVIGVKGLRAVSGAVLPTIPSGNTNIPIMMVAEKASDIIKRNIKCSRTTERPKNCRRQYRSNKK